MKHQNKSTDAVWGSPSRIGHKEGKTNDEEK
jgi:hypothetical protein